MNHYLIKATGETLVGSFLGNRITKYICSEKKSLSCLKEFNKTDCSVIFPIIPMIPIILSLCFKSLRQQTGFHVTSAFALACLRTYLDKKPPLTPEEQEKLKIREYIKTAIEDFNQLLPQILDKGDLKTDYKTRYINSARHLRYFTKQDIPEIDDILLEQSDISKNIASSVKYFKEKLQNKTAITDKHTSKNLLEHYKIFLEKINAIEEKLDKYKTQTFIKHGTYEGFNILRSTFILFKKDYLEPYKESVKDDAIQISNNILLKSVQDTQMTHTINGQNNLTNISQSLEKLNVNELHGYLEFTADIIEEMKKHDTNNHADTYQKKLSYFYNSRKKIDAIDKVKGETEFSKTKKELLSMLYNNIILLNVPSDIIKKIHQFL